MDSIKNLLSIPDTTGNCRLSLNVFKGKTYFSIFKNEGNHSPLSIWVSDTIKNILTEVITDLIKNPKSKEIKNIYINTYDQDNKSYKKQSILSVLTDDVCKIALGITGITSFNENVPKDLLNKKFIFVFDIPKPLEIDGLSNDRDKNFKAAKIFLNILNTKCVISEVLTSNGNSFVNNETNTNVEDGTLF